MGKRKECVERVLAAASKKESKKRVVDLGLDLGDLSDSNDQEFVLGTVDFSEVAQDLMQREEAEGFFRFPTSDYEARDQFSRLFGPERLRYVEGAGILPPTWFHFDGVRWSSLGYYIHTLIKDYIDAVHVIFVHVTKEEWQSLTERTNKDFVKRLKTYVRSLKRDPSRKNSILRLLPEVLTYRIDESDFDAPPHLLNVLNGTVDLSKGVLRPHSPNDLLRKLIPFDFDSKASCPTWERFVSDIAGGDAELVKYLQKLAGYSSSGETRERQFFIHYGPKGSNGKSTFLETPGEIMADYSFTVDRSLFVDIGGRHKSTEYTQAKLQGVRNAFTSETERSDTLSLSKLKTFAGNDTITARNPYGQPFSLKPICKLHLATNHIPQADGTDDAIWSRTVIIPYEVEFKGDREDKNLREKLRAEYPGILMWIIRGARLYYSEGLEVPKRIREYLDEERKEADEILCFLDEECEIASGQEECAKDVYERYRHYLSKNFRNRTPFGHRRFYAEMEKRAKKMGSNGGAVFATEKRSNPNQLFFVGLSLANSSGGAPFQRKNEGVQPEMKRLVQDFIDDRCSVDPEESVVAERAFSKFKAYVVENGEYAGVDYRSFVQIVGSLDGVTVEQGRKDVFRGFSVNTPLRVSEKSSGVKKAGRKVLPSPEMVASRSRGSNGNVLHNPPIQH